MSHMHIGLSGRYTIEKRNAAGEVVQTLEFDNLITDAGLERWGTAGVASICKLGSGITLPAATDTAMDVFLGSTSSTITAPAPVSDIANRRLTAFFKWRAGPGVGTGRIREIGVGWDSVSVGLWSRALVVDGNGNTTVIDKLADETLDVTYAITMQWPSADVIDTITVDAVPRTCTTRPYSMPTVYADRLFVSGWGQSANPYGSFYAYSGGATAAFSGTSPTGAIPTAGASADTAVPYVAGSKARATRLNFLLGQGVGDIRTIKYSHTTTHPFSVEMMTEFNPPIQKLDTQELEIVVTISWGRA